MRSEKGLILTLSIIFMLILLIISGVAIILMTNQARITSGRVKRIRAYYTAEAAITKALEELRKGGLTIPSPGFRNPAYLSLNGQTAALCGIAADNSFDCDNNPATPDNFCLPGGPNCLRATVSY